MCPDKRASSIVHLAAALLLMGLLAPVALAQPQARGFELQAAFIYSFSAYVRWPDGVPAPGAPFRFCISGPDRGLAAAFAAVTNTAVLGRPLAVEQLAPGADAHRCQILAFVEGSDLGLLSTLADAPVLTVGSDAGFLEAGGMVRLVRESGRLRFDINQRAARRADLLLSSNLLKLARVIGE